MFQAIALTVLTTYACLPTPYVASYWGQRIVMTTACNAAATDRRDLPVRPSRQQYGPGTVARQRSPAWHDRVAPQRETTRSTLER